MLGTTTAGDERGTPLLGGLSPPSPHRLLRLAFVVGAITIGASSQFGFASGVLNNLEEVVPGSVPMSRPQWALVVSGFGVGGLVGSSLVTSLSLAFGRKTTLLGTNALVCASSALLMAGTAWYVLFLARVLVGIVGGLVAGIVPMYFAEISPTTLRAAVGTTHQLGITLGLLLSQVWEP